MEAIEALSKANKTKRIVIWSVVGLAVAGAATGAIIYFKNKAKKANPDASKTGEKTGDTGTGGGTSVSPTSSTTPASTTTTPIKPAPIESIRPQTDTVIHTKQK